MSAASSERRNRQRKRRQKDDFSTSARHGGVESFSSPCDVSNSYSENSNQAVENPTSSSYFIPGISGKARCLTDAALPYLAKPERDSQMIGAILEISIFPWIQAKESTIVLEPAIQEHSQRRNLENEVSIAKRQQSVQQDNVKRMIPFNIDWDEAWAKYKPCLVQTVGLEGRHALTR